MRKSDLNKNLNDKDIAALFDQQEIVVPKSLDDIILSASRQAQADAPPSTTSMKKYSSWFAVAAVLVLAVALGPLLLNAPQSERQVDRPLITQEIYLETSSDLAPAISAPAAKQKTSTPPAAEPVSVRVAKPVAESVAAPVAKSVAKPASASTSITIDQLELKTLSGSSSFTSLTSTLLPVSNNSKGSFRESPELWLNEIKQLVAQNNMFDARVEYHLFRQNHPTFEKEFEFPEH